MGGRASGTTRSTQLLVAILAVSLISAVTPRSRSYRYVASDAGWSSFERLVQSAETPAGQLAALGIVYADVRSGRLTFRVDDAGASAIDAVPGQQPRVPVFVSVTGRELWKSCLPSGQIVSLRGLKAGAEAWIFVGPWPYHCGSLGTTGGTAGTITVFR